MEKIKAWWAEAPIKTRIIVGAVCVFVIIALISIATGAEPPVAG